jgi:hypothetical protein
MLSPLNTSHRALNKKKTLPADAVRGLPQTTSRLRPLRTMTAIEEHDRRVADEAYHNEIAMVMRTPPMDMAYNILTAAFPDNNDEETPATFPTTAPEHAPLDEATFREKYEAFYSGKKKPKLPKFNGKYLDIYAYYKCVMSMRTEDTRKCVVREERAAPIGVNLSKTICTSIFPPPARAQRHR